MNFSNPILICDPNEDVRVLLRDMLTKNGFFHVLEASTEEEIIRSLHRGQEFFVLIGANLVSTAVERVLRLQKEYIVFAENSDARTPLLAAKLGVHHLMSYPFHSKKLIGRINSML